MRVSSLPKLVACPGWWLLEERRVDRQVGAAADTGSAVGRAIQLYHEGHPDREAIALALQDRTKYPRAQERRVRRLALAYCDDERNPQVIAGECEREVRGSLSDEFGAPIELVGHVDQVRGNVVWDLKAGTARDGPDLLWSYAPQLAGYAFCGMWQVGGIIRLADYEEGGQVFWDASALDVDRILSTVRRDVGDLRTGRAFVRPGRHCSWCAAGSPETCAAWLEEQPPKREEIS